MNNIIMSAKQVGDMIGVSGETVRRWARAHEIPCQNLAGRKTNRPYYLDRRMILRWLDLGRPGALDTPVQRRRSRRCLT
jgi:helix-turn-helix protein